MKTIIYIDYETVRKINLEDFKNDNYYVYFFIPSSLNINDRLQEEIDSSQNFNIIIPKGNDINNNVFHIFLTVGEHNAIEPPETEFIIASKKRNMKDILKYLKGKNRKCRRLEDLNIRSIQHSLNQIDNSPKKSRAENNFDEIVDILQGIKPLKRPKKAKAIKNYISNLYKEKPNKDELAIQIYDYLIEQHILIESRKAVEYHFSETKKTPSKPDPTSTE